MARKAKTKADSGEEKVSTQVSVLINPKQLDTLLKNCKSINKQTAELTGSLREKIAYAVDKQGLHKKAFAVLRQLDKMEPEKLLEFWTHLSAYMDMSGINDRMNSVGSLDLDGEEEPEGDDVGGQPANVASLADKRRRRSAAAADEGEDAPGEAEAVH